MYTLPDVMAEPVTHAASLTPNGLLRIRIESLLGTKQELTLIYREQEYRLRITQNGKLILTK